MLVPVFLAASLVAAGTAKAAPTPSPRKTVEELDERRRKDAFIHFAGPDEDSRRIVREVFAELGFDPDESPLEAVVDTKWRLVETVTTPPRAARRHRLQANLHEGTCWVQLRIETTYQRDEGGGRFVWADWFEPRFSEPTEQERAVFRKARTLLLERLPKPDPYAPPPGMEPTPEAAAAPKTEPIPLFKPQPPYPEAARSANLRGTVELEIVINTKGEVTSAKIVKSQPPFDEPALSTVKKWRYQPFMVDGRAVETTTRVSIPFGL